MSQNKTDDAALAALLDEALQGFIKPHEAVSEPAPRDEPTEASSSDTIPTAPPSTTQPSTSTSKTAPKGLGFDPLASSKPKKQTQPKATPVAAQQQPVEDADIAAGLSKLLAELAQADMQPQSSNHQQPPSQEDLASTLKALADQQQNTFGGSKPPAGLGGLGLGNMPGGEDMTPEEEAAFIAQLTQQLQGLASGEGDEAYDGNEEGMGGMNSLVDTIMAQLLSKDVLYQPMKDIGAKYPEWLAANEGKLPPEEMTRYREQYDYINKICALYESDPNNFTELMDLLQEMQKRGQPPQEIVDELAPGAAFGPEGVLGGGLPAGLGGGAPPPDCCIQ